MENIFDYVNMDGDAFFNFIHNWGEHFQQLEEKRKKEREEVIAKLLAEAPFKIEYVEFTKNERSRYNIERECEYKNMIYICDRNDNRLFNSQIFRLDDVMQPNAEAKFIAKLIDGNRYKVLTTYVITKFSESTIKECKLKSPYHFSSRNCVIDMEDLNVPLYISGNSFSDYVHIYDNVMVRTEKDRVIYLPTMECIAGNFSTLFNTEENLVLELNKNYGNSPTTSNMIVVNKKSGMVTRI